MGQSKSKRPIRVLHCPAMVGGNPQSLARAERELGLESWAVSFYQSSIGYKTDEVLWKEGDHPIICEAKRFWLLWRALRHFDIIHFNFGQSILPHRVDANEEIKSKFSSWIKQKYYKYPSWIKRVYGFYSSLFELRDLSLLKKAGKGIVVTYQGDDARQGGYCLDNFEVSPATEVEPGYYSKESDIYKQNKIKRFASYADRIYALNPDLLNVLPASARFLPYANVDLREWMPSKKKVSNPRLPVILHAPSHEGIKGTKYVMDAISRLKAERIPLEFILVEGFSHIEALRLYQQADLLIDQMLCGWYGGLAVEFMALGKPVICYIREGDLKFIPEQMRNDLPIINVTPVTLYNVVKEWLTIRKSEFQETGRRSREYVEKWHDPLRIANQLKKEYQKILATKGPDDDKDLQNG